MFQSGHVEYWNCLSVDLRECVRLACFSCLFAYAVEINGFSNILFFVTYKLCFVWGECLIDPRVSLLLWYGCINVLVRAFWLLREELGKIWEIGVGWLDYVSSMTECFLLQFSWLSTHGEKGWELQYCLREPLLQLPFWYAAYLLVFLVEFRINNTTEYSFSWKIFLFFFHA